MKLLKATNKTNHAAHQPRHSKKPTTIKKTQQPQDMAARYDFFTRLCASLLGVECIKEHRFHPPRRWRFDYAIPSQKIAVEVEGGIWTGGRHTSPKGFLGDIEKYNAAAVDGWSLLRVTPDTLTSSNTISMIQAIIDRNKHENI